MALDPLLRKYFHVVALLLLALSAYFEAAGANELVRAALVAPAVKEREARKPALAVADSTPRSAQPIIDRNPFDSVTGPLNPKPVEPTAAEPPELEQKDPLAVAPCEGITAFIITESTDRLWSVAALQGTGEPRPRLRRVGDDVAGKKIEYIGFNPVENSPSVWLSEGARLCQTLLFSEAPPAPAAGAPPPPTPTPATPAPASTRGAPKVPADIASKIQKISDNEFHIDRAVVDRILENQSELMKSARITPEQKDGKVVGIRLSGIRPDTLLGTLGIQNGDRLDSINGFNMGSPEKALEAYARLRTAPNLNVQVTRGGAPMTIDYRIK